MVHLDWLIVVVGLFLGTYAGRVVPFWFSGFDRLPAPLHRFLELVPAAALGALIVPDALLQATPMVAIGAPLIAFVLALRGFNLTVVVLVSILSGWIGLSLLG
ncbi:MAG TPA: AzlD domain-containing protein [Alkalispirochaeta sp.]|nr:AzlD domain-containing protein [Alkalispirochaeta sp.]